MSAALALAVAPPWAGAGSAGEDGRFPEDGECRFGFKQHKIEIKCEGDAEEFKIECKFEGGEEVTARFFKECFFAPI